MLHFLALVSFSTQERKESRSGASVEGDGSAGGDEAGFRGRSRGLSWGREAAHAGAPALGCNTLACLAAQGLGWIAGEPILSPSSIWCAPPPTPLLWPLTHPHRPRLAETGPGLQLQGRCGAQPSWEDHRDFSPVIAIVVINMPVV